MSDEEGKRTGLEEQIAGLKENTLTCPICHKLFYEPVTTTCGHTFCKECLSRAVDFTQACPYCRATLRLSDGSSLLTGPIFAVNTVLRDILTTLFASEYRARHAEESTYLSQTILKLTKPHTDRMHDDLDSTNDHDEDEPTDECDTFGLPLFPLPAVVFPGHSFPMHIFEPRYRLMLRRIVQGDKKFGIVRCKNDGSFESVGCIVKVSKVTMLPDGRSLIDTVGTHRFTIVRSAVMDGYYVARVRFLYDVADPTDSERLPGVDLHNAENPNSQNRTSRGPQANNEDAREHPHDIVAMKIELRVLLTRVRDAIAPHGEVDDILRRVCTWADRDGNEVPENGVEVLGSDRRREQTTSPSGASNASISSDSSSSPMRTSSPSTSCLTLLAAGFLISDENQRQQVLQSQSTYHRLRVILPKLRALAQSVSRPGSNPTGANNPTVPNSRRGGCVVQ